MQVLPVKVVGNPAFPALQPQARGLPASTARILPHAAQKVFQDDADAEAKAAMLAISKSQEDNFQALLARLTQDALAKVKIQSADERATLEQEYNKRNRRVSERLRALFEQFAQPIGKDRRALAFKVGFPDPPVSPDKPASPEVSQLRAHIRSLSAQYREQVQVLISDLDAEFQAKRLKLGVQESKDLERLKSEAEAEARRIAFQAIADLESVHTRLTGSLPPSPSFSLQIPSVPAPQPIAPPPALPGQPLPDLLAVFAASRGYRLSRNQTGRNATAEFLQWQKQYELGHSANLQKSSAAR